MSAITNLSVLDIRFPTSRTLDRSDAINAAPDYSAAYVMHETDSLKRLTGHGLTFTIGRGNEICVQGGTPRALVCLAHAVRCLGELAEYAEIGIRENRVGAA